MRDRRGSALLIVLGFLSFMVVSAVAFSIYMRSERVPSSVFRRNVSIRHLVRAGLAHAISELDDAIRADPFPGVNIPDGNNASLRAYRNLPNGDIHYADTWFGRVFMPPNPDDKEDDSYMAPESETVAVLNLEGLGYVPPPLINDVRFLSRRSWAAKWRSFDYGAGRFAFCAVNVSDYFDINRVKAGGSRTSGERVNLSSLFADRYDSPNEGVSDAGTFSTFVTTRGGTQGTWPFVSMLDYALAMRNGAGGFESPFYRWIGKTSSGTMYENNTDDAQNQVFVTDSWMPDDPNEELADSAIVDFNDRGSGNNQDAQSGQPFPKDWMQDGNSVSFQDVMNQANSDFIKRVASGSLPSGSSLSGNQNKSLMPLDATLLKDYLDRDDTPTSLALPCVERVPMVAAMGIQNLTINLGLVGTTRTDGPNPGPNNSQVTTEYTEYKLNPSTFAPGARLSAAVVFPFKRAGEINQTFKAKALMRVFLVDETATGLRVDSGKALASLRPSVDADWNESKVFQLNGLSADVPPFVFTLVSAEQTIDTSQGDILEQQDVAVGNGSGNSVEFRFDLPNGFDNQIVFTKKVETKKSSTDGGVSYQTTTEPAEYKFDASPFNVDGSLVETARDNWRKEDEFASAFGSRKFTLHAAVWVRIEHQSGDVVDLVPAIAEDDMLYNSINNSRVAQQGYDGFNSAGVPIFRFRASAGSTIYDIANAASPLNIPAGSWTPGTYCAVDPRFNWAPEDWLPRNSAVTADGWVDWITGRAAANGTDELLATDGRDSDIFMFASNQGFMQSMGELAFLPVVTDFGDQTAKGAMSPSDLLKAATISYNGAEHSDSDPWSVIPCHDLVWRTYRSYRSAADGDNTQHLLDFRNFYGGSPSESQAFRNFGAQGVRVNPYTDSEGVRMAAFAYTPYDWWAAAGTNTLWSSSNSKDSEGSRQSKFRNLSDSRKYTFNESSSEAKMKSDDIKAVGNAICNAIRNAPASSWQTVYDGLDWYGNGTIDPDNEASFKNFLGVDLDEPLHGVDRKFLHAFWRDCLANRQQLFLVFVRAESMALGGSGEGQIPPQQGGRAVALVWRDPKAPTTSSGGTATEGNTVTANNRKPHRTRILFFHQFD